MTIELVDGHGGKPHISGDDLGDFKAGILGDAGYVFKRADMLAATLNGANSLTVNTGSGVLPVSGRHFRITAPETVTVTSGTQGQNRNDLVVIRPSTSTDGTTVENASVVVLRGTPTGGDAVDPEKEDTDLALYRLQLTGISVADPIALFDVMVPYNEFRDSISRMLWSGSWSSGSLEVSGISKYTLLAITAVDSNSDATKILAVIDGTRVTGIGGVQLSSTLSTVGFVANLSGDTLSFVRCKTMAHNASGQHGGLYDCTVTRIDGIA